jgi:glycosyltransferase involved in cell wall biosynthesis
VGILAYWYPPLEVVGAQRPRSLARLLPEHGWTPLVISVAPTVSPYLAHRDDVSAEWPSPILRTADRSLAAIGARLARLAGTRDVERMGMQTALASRSALRRGLYGLVRQVAAFPDDAWPWLAEAGRMERALRGAGATALLSTSAPVTAHLLASRLSRRLGVPWVADYRDLWSQRTEWRRVAPLASLESWLERRALARAAAVVTVSDPLAARLAGFLGREVTVVPNGFEPVSPASLGAVDPLPLDPAMLTILHTGTLTARDRDPGLLFAALDRLAREARLDLAHVQVWFVGRNLEVARRALTHWPALADRVRLVPQVDRATALDAQRRASLLLVLGSTDPRAAGDVTTKVYEYLAAERPVLAVAARGGALDRLLAETRGGIVASTPEEVAAALLHWARLHGGRGAIPWDGDRQLVARYDRRVAAAAFARLLDAVTGRVGK